jgi:hypothetical protein
VIAMKVLADILPPQQCARDIVRRLFVCAMMAQPTRLQSS